jgi:wyosine [tRNA(Phe)-imidazoG37] synthetase (radical SAM superfamily)
MPLHEEIKEFAEKIANNIGFKVADEKRDSRVVLLKK